MLVRNWLINLFLLVSLIGVLDAGYLTFSYLSDGDAGCFLIEGCNIVLNSQYAYIFGIPVAVLGFLYYLAIFLGVLTFNFNKNEKLMKIISLSTVMGLLASLWFVYIQSFVLKEFCSYCILSALTSFTLFGLGMYTLKVLNLPPGYDE